ncbi:hypothetical protein [Dehalobacter sp. 14DCB1]|uniref:hypothetical protein n=1 Tax=Dehalobacter sp. 14DCB1 TaxID=2070227 RepID=UPI00104EAEC2|nr:hypothetical protein [Dehalobacter sp. 14DCB1]TCX53601.1 hypothetical protein C1I36_02345 [Dehalobacter sp. 14DCB1]
MSETIRIIIIEDDEQQKNMYRDAIEEFNYENGVYVFESVMMNDDENLPRLLYEDRCDCLIIDLNWGADDVSNSGNRVIQTIVKNKRVPIVVMSGNLNLLEEDISDSNFFTKHDRTDLFSDVLNEIVSIYQTGYTKALGYSGKIDELLNEVFWKYLSSNINHWENIVNGTKEKRILRYAITRINEMLTLEGEKHDDYNAIEFYIKPSLKDKAFSGDIVIIEDKKYIIISASCDMEQDNAEYVVMCKIEFNEIASLLSKVKEDDVKAKDRLRSFVNNAKSRYHLLPPCRIFPGALIDFQQVNCISREELDEKCSVFASVLPVFAKDIHGRFSQYYGRQGQPQLNLDDIITFVKK